MSLISIFFIHLLALASPGPDFVFISQTAAHHSKKVTLLAISGVCSAIVIWVLLAVSGLSIIIDHSPIIYKILLTLGGSYLIYLGVASIKSCFNQSNNSEPLSTIQHKFFLKGLMTNLANPKALAYFASIFSVAVIHASLHQIILMIIVVLVESLLWFYLVATLFSTQLIANWYQKQLKIINMICGLAFIGFGVGLFYTVISH